MTLSSSVYYYRSCKKPDDEIIAQLSLLADNHPRWGFWMMYHRLRKVGYNWNHKRVYRVYSSMRLNLRSKRKKRLPSRVKSPIVRPLFPNVTWSLDFMHDTLSSRKSVRSFNIIDDFNREVLSITVDSSISSFRIIRELDKLIEWRGKPDKIRSDNGPEFVLFNIADWCYRQGIEWEYIRPGKLTENSLIERFNRTFRDDVLDWYLFDSITELSRHTQKWMWMYNNERPHSALGYLTPVEFLLKYGKLSDKKFPTFQQDINNIDYENKANKVKPDFLYSSVADFGKITLGDYRFKITFAVTGNI